MLLTLLKNFLCNKKQTVFYFLLTSHLPYYVLLVGLQYCLCYRNNICCLFRFLKYIQNTLLFYVVFNSRHPCEYTNFLHRSPWDQACTFGRFPKGSFGLTPLLNWDANVIKFANKYDILMKASLIFVFYSNN